MGEFEHDIASVRANRMADWILDSMDRMVPGSEPPAKRETDSPGYLIAPDKDLSKTALLLRNEPDSVQADAAKRLLAEVNDKLHNRPDGLAPELNFTGVALAAVSPAEPGNLLVGAIHLDNEKAEDGHKHIVVALRDSVACNDDVSNALTGSCHPVVDDSRYLYKRTTDAAGLISFSPIGERDTTKADAFVWHRDDQGRTISLNGPTKGFGIKNVTYFGNTDEPQEISLENGTRFVLRPHSQNSGVIISPDKTELPVSSVRVNPDSPELKLEYIVSDLSGKYSVSMNLSGGSSVTYWGTDEKKPCEEKYYREPADKTWTGPTWPFGSYAPVRDAQRLNLNHLTGMI